MNALFWTDEQTYEILYDLEGGFMVDYSAMIENRKSVRAFKEKSVPNSALAEIGAFYRNECHRLVPGIRTQLQVFGVEVRETLEGAAGYNDFLIGAPQYLVLFSEKAEYAGENAGYIMEDIILKLTDMGLDSCWITFADPAKVKDALKFDTDLEVAAVVAFGYGEKKSKKMRFNILSMSNVTVEARRHYYDPKVSIHDIVFMDQWGCRNGVDEHIGFYEDILWNAFRAAALSPSYMNRQPYGFVIQGHHIILVSTPDEFTDKINGDLNLGVVMLHFAAVASQFSGKVGWTLGSAEDNAGLPEGYTAIASCNF